MTYYSVNINIVEDGECQRDMANRPMLYASHVDKAEWEEIQHLGEWVSSL